MKRIILFTVLIAALTACKKENNTNSTTSASSYERPTSVGSYWVYRWDKVDSNGTVTPQPYVDTVRITGDTTINGKVYTTYYGSTFGSSPYYWYERDSSGFIVNQTGKISYSHLSGSGSFSSVVDGPFLEELFYSPTVTLQVDAGTFQQVKDVVLAFSRNDQSPVNACGDQVVYLHSYYASGVGLLRRETGYYSEITAQCKEQVSTLTAWHIEP